jgi:hypothetical protein
VVVPPYCRSRSGRVYRIHRVSEQLGPDRMRYTLRATPLTNTVSTEVSREVDTVLIMEKIAHRQIVPTPEETFEQLWQQLRIDLDAVNRPTDETD